MKDAITGRVRGGYCRAVIINPLHPQLPKLVVMVQVTCNRFTAAHVRSQWERLYDLWYRDGGKNLGSILGPLVGHGSDGDARRFKLQLQDMSNTSETRFGIAWRGFTLSGYLQHGRVRGIHAQDVIHNAKKGVNPLDVNSRIIQLGEFPAIWEHIQLVFRRFDPDKHGLRASDEKRPDRQDFSAVQRVARNRCRRCLAALRPGVKTEGTEAWLEMIYDYLIAHFGTKIALISRVQNL
jgi:hypothetical protein